MGKLDKESEIVGLCDMKKAIITFLKIIIFFLAWVALSGMIGIPSNNPAIWKFFAELIPFTVIPHFYTRLRKSYWFQL